MWRQWRIKQSSIFNNQRGQVLFRSGSPVSNRKVLWLWTTLHFQHSFPCSPALSSSPWFVQRQIRQRGKSWEETLLCRQHSPRTPLPPALGDNYFCVTGSRPLTLSFSLQRFPCQALIPLLATQLHVPLGGLMIYTVPSPQDFHGHVIRGERSLQRCSSHESQRQSQSVCLIPQSAVPLNETMWSAAHRGEESRKGEAGEKKK